MEFFDTHAHLDVKEFDEDRAEVLNRALQAGVTRIVNIGATDQFEGAERSIRLASEHPFIWTSVGIHPHDAALPLDLERLKSLSSAPKVVAIGETGLDFYRDWSPRDRQYEWFEAQIALAIEVSLPLVIHSRNAAFECLEVLQRAGAERVGGVFHCFSEDAAFAEKLREMNFLVSFPGSITFKKAEALREAARSIPLEQILIETDAPYMAPEPFRGKRCESSHVVNTAQRLAEIKGIALEELATVTTQNACRFFGITRST